MIHEDGTSLLAPRSLTMERLANQDEVLLLQSTSQCCRCCCLQHSINYLLAEQEPLNYEPTINPFADVDATGWIHEESSWCGRTWSCMLPGCRAIRYVQHAGPPPAAVVAENEGWCTCQTGPVTQGLTQQDREADVVAIHRKKATCGYCLNLGDLAIPVCNCCPLPYLETTSADGQQVLGRTRYVCDACCFVPKYDVTNAQGDQMYRIRPDTCVMGMCVQCRCDGKKSKCCRVPFVVRHPVTKEPVAADVPRYPTAQIDNLWTGWANECCTLRGAYHVTFPRQVPVEDKLVLTGAALLVDLTMFEQKQND